VPFDREEDFTFMATAYYLSPAVRAHWEKQLGGPVLWFGTTLEAIADYLEKLEVAARERPVTQTAPGPATRREINHAARKNSAPDRRQAGRAGPARRRSSAMRSPRPDELSGDALDKLLQDEFKITAFQCLVAKARALNLSPYNVARYKVSPQTFERIPQEFCQEHLVLPVGQVGENAAGGVRQSLRGHPARPRSRR
jgi:hypothetical protein